MAGARPIVSIIIPLYKSSPTIGAVLESIDKLNFNKEDIEIFMIYYPLPGDNTEKLVKKFIEKNGHKYYSVRLIFRDDRRANYARNLGIKLSNSEYVFLLNDDILLPSKILTYALEHFKNPEVGAVTFPYMLQPPRIFEEAMFFRFYGRIKRTKVLNLGCSIIRKSIIKEIGFINENLGPPISSNDDYEFSARMAKAGYKIIIDGRMTLRDIGALKETNPESTGHSVLNVLRWYKKLAWYDVTIGADTYHLVLRSAPLSWKLEVPFYLAMPAAPLLLTLFSPFLGLLAALAIIVTSIVYYRATRPKWMLYSLLLLARRVHRAYGYVLRRAYLLFRKLGG